MKKSSIILLGYGLGYVIISILVAIDFISLSSQDILPLSIASLIFSLAEFWNVGVRLIILSLRQLAFRFFAMMAFTRFKNRHISSLRHPRPVSASADHSPVGARIELVGW